MSLAIRARQPPSKPHHGQFIYLFSNLTTNQVIYSLEREIHTEKQERVILSQLPYYAKKTVPTKLRKDLWKPYATVTFPDAALGLQAFKLLREYRMVRHHSWTIAPPSPSLTRKQQNSKEFGQRSLVVSPGSWPSKKERAKLIMDQRATSVADLSHILTRQLSQLADPLHQTARERGAEISRQKLWAKVQALASTPTQDVKVLEDEMAQLQALVDAPSHKQQGLAEKTKMKKRMRRIKEITAQLNRLRKAREAVTFANGGEVDEKLRRKWSKTLKYIVQMQNPSRQVIEGYSIENAQSRKEKQDAARPTNWPKDTTYDFDNWTGQPKMLTTRDRIALQNKAPELDTRLEKDLPEDSVLISWANLPDAQYARKWHESVVHEAMQDKYTVRALRRIEKGIRENEEGFAVEGAGEARTLTGEKYRHPGFEQKEEEEPRGFLGKLNPMRLFARGGSSAEARV